MLRENITMQLHRLKKTQMDLSKELDIDYVTLNLFLNGHKGLWYKHIKRILDHIGLEAHGTLRDEGDDKSIHTVAWMEAKLKKVKPMDIAARLGISYSALNGFLNGRSGMAVGKVEELMEMLNIKLVPRAKSATHP